MKRKIVKKAISAPDLLNEPIEYNKAFSRGIKINFGELSVLFISGTASVDRDGKTLYPGDFIAQTKRTFNNLTALLESEGADWKDVVQTRCYLKNMKDYEKFNEFRTRFYKRQKLQPLPASVCVEANLCRPDLLVEIEVIAAFEKPR